MRRPAADPAGVLRSREVPLPAALGASAATVTQKERAAPEGENGHQRESVKVRVPERSFMVMCISKSALEEHSNLLCSADSGLGAMEIKAGNV